MKKLFDYKILCALAVLLSYGVNCQEINDEANYPGITSIDYEVISNDITGFPKLNFVFNPLLLSASLRRLYLGASVSYTNPRIFKTEFGLIFGGYQAIGGFSFQNLFYLNYREKIKNKSITLRKTEGYKFMVDENTVKASQLGLSAGFTNRYLGRWSHDSTYNNGFEEYVLREFSFGINFVHSSCIKYKVNINGEINNQMKLARTSYFGEILYIMNALKYGPYGYSYYGLTGLEEPKNIFGFRFGMQGYVGSRIGFTYKFGLESNALRYNKLFNPFLNLGLYLAFI